MFTRLGLVAAGFGLLGVLSAAGIIPTDSLLGGCVLAVSLLISGFLGAFKTQEVISPLFRSSRWQTILIKIISWWFIVLGLVYTIALVAGILSG
jgi:hypothetical protein